MPDNRVIEFQNRISEAVSAFIANEDEYEDNVQLAINPSDLSVEIADPDDDLPNLDYFPMMDLVRGSAENAGTWEPDEEAIAEVAAQYVATE